MNLVEFEALERDLRNLDRNTSTSRRLQVLERLIDYLHGPIKADDGFACEELAHSKLPKPLIWWLHFAGKRRSILSHQNNLLLPDAPDELDLDESGRYVFYSENQWVYLWSVVPNGEDPAVWGRFNEDELPWQKEGMVLSEFLVGACLFEGIMQSPYMATAAWIKPDVIHKLKTEIPELRDDNDSRENGPLTSWKAVKRFN